MTSSSSSPSTRPSWATGRPRATAPTTSGSASASATCANGSRRRVRRKHPRSTARQSLPCSRAGRRRNLPSSRHIVAPFNLLTTITTTPIVAALQQSLGLTPLPIHNRTVAPPASYTTSPSPAAPTPYHCAVRSLSRLTNQLPCALYLLRVEVSRARRRRQLVTRPGIERRCRAGQEFTCRSV
jgi:hypothetical protein